MANYSDIKFAKTSAQEPMFRNLIINGDMSIAQRATSATGIGNGDTGYHTLDRWKFFENDSPSYEFTMSQDTDVPTGQGFAKSLKMDCTTADGSLATDDLAFLEHYIEGQNVQSLKKGTANAEYVTASWWVKSTKTGSYIVELVDLDNNRFTNFNYTVNASDTWEKKTVTFVPDTSGALDNDNGGSLLFRFGLIAGTTFSSGTPSPTTWLDNSGNNGKRAANQVNIADNTANNFLITGVQLEVGQSATDFEFLPYDVNLKRCERYCISTPFINNADSLTAPTTRGCEYQGSRQKFADVTGYRSEYIHFPERMRATPTITTFNGNNSGTTGQFQLRLHTDASQDFGGFVQVNELAFNFSGYTGLTLGNSGDVVRLANVHWLASAEI